MKYIYENEDGEWMCATNKKILKELGGEDDVIASGKNIDELVEDLDEHYFASELKDHLDELIDIFNDLDDEVYYDEDKVRELLHLDNEDDDEDTEDDEDTDDDEDEYNIKNHLNDLLTDIESKMDDISDLIFDLRDEIDNLDE